MVESEILTALTSVSPTIAGGRVYAMVLPDGTDYPAVTYQRISAETHNSLSGWSGRDHVRMQIDCWAQGYDEAKRLAAEVRLAMEGAGFKGLMVNDSDDFEPDLELFRVSADYMVWQKRT